MVEFDSDDTAETAIGKLLWPTWRCWRRSHLIAKFTGYQYGGRPLGITFVKYLNAEGGPEDMMESAEPTGITQDQIM